MISVKLYLPDVSGDMSPIRRSGVCRFATSVPNADMLGILDADLLGLLGLLGLQIVEVLLFS